MEFVDYAKRIIRLKDEDLELRDRLIQNRELSQGYNEEMEKLHKRNSKILNEIIDEIGYPTIEKVGGEASEAAWLIIQHSIGQPEFMRKCVDLLKNVVNENKANRINLAFLTDRIAVFEGKPQLYGTQFDWDETGELIPNQFDDLDRVNYRRKSIGLNKLEEQIEIMRRRVKNESQSPPTDFEKRKEQFEQWRKKTGWIK
ncbi:hypothetical protein OAG16_03355 [Saprospiraceae bacterium]|nr:hypothetical protein [Saprospiraceae bacterium]